jgi:endoglucanase
LPVSWAGQHDHENKSGTDNSKAYTRNRNIGRGINFGNALEAPDEGEWGLTIKESYVQAIAYAGFNSVRLPICWSAHTGTTSPYNIDAAFFNRVDEVMSWCLSRNLAVIITIHHFNELYNYPDDMTYLNMFFAIWRQLTEHYLSVDHERLFFEVLNEPEVNLTAEKWNILIPRVIDSIRIRDDDRTLIIDAPDYANHTSLVKLNIPRSEQNVIVSTRYYLPWQFAQQGAWWSDWTDLNQYLGTRWTGTASEKNAVLEDMAIIRNWSENNSRPVTIGEWGSIMFADNQSRLTWTNYVRRQIEESDFSWSYFDFGVVFKIYSIAENKWLTGFVEALTGDGETVTDGRTSDSIRITPADPTKNDSITVRSYITIPNICSKTDSTKVTVTGLLIKVKSWHTEHIPQSDVYTTCPDSIKLGRIAPGSYTLIFDSDYLDNVNSIHYSVPDTIDFMVSDATAVDDETYLPVTVYPVPAHNFLIVGSIDSGCLYEIYDLSGQLLDTGTVGNRGINVSSLKSGEYILRIMQDANALLRRRIIVIR